MRFVNRDYKGTYGYIKKQTIFEIIKTLVLFIMAFGLYLIGYLTLKTNKSLWSVFAVLAMLPAAKSLVGVIMFLRYRSLKEEVYRRYEEARGNISCLYENVITTEKKSFYLPCIACSNNTIITFVDSVPNSEVKNLQIHLENVLRAGGHKNATIKVFDKEESFLGRLSQMRDNMADEEQYVSTVGIFETLKAVSL